VPTTDHLRHPDWPEIYAIGDIVSHSWPKMAHSAMVQARVAVHDWVGRQFGRKKRPAPYRPQLVWALETGPGEAFFALSDVFYGGQRQWVYHGRSPYWAKQGVQWAYVRRHGELPIMP
jgi:sulfide:quinone oxidoreductase